MRLEFAIDGTQDEIADTLDRLTMRAPDDDCCPFGSAFLDRLRMEAPVIVPVAEETEESCKDD